MQNLIVAWKMDKKYCKSCRFNDQGYCTNEKLDEDFSQSKDARRDMLIYSYNEGGSFMVGELFGCVHHEEQTKSTCRQSEEIEVQNAEMELAAAASTRI